MRSHLLLAWVVLLMPAAVAGQGSDAARDTTTTMTIPIPRSIQEEHREIHAALEAAVRAPGRTGNAARELAEVLHPHFVREEQIALPPLGLLRPLAAGDRPPEAAAALAMADSLRRELPGMLREHGRIRTAVERLRAAAVAERNALAARLAEQLALHAQTEEEVLYPAAILVGDVIRARSGR
jgi:iron-sulfur cluster repair protein YtfE (RIC family)